MTGAQLAVSATCQVTLRQDTPQADVTCTIVGADGSTGALPVHMLSLRGAQREVTGWLIAGGYEPVGPWKETGGGEAVRRFRATTDAEAEASPSDHDDTFFIARMLIRGLSREQVRRLIVALGALSQ